MNIISVIK